MRTLIKFISIIGVLASLSLYANTPVVFSDVSAGVFRFQIKLAEQGNSEAQYKVGEMYEMGSGVSKDFEKAQVWYEKSAAQGHKKAGYKLLYLEIQNNGLNDFTKTQLGILRQEAAGGEADAQYFLGKMYSSGTGVPKSLNNALTWLNKATFNGVPEAEHEAIEVEEELARIREKEARKRADMLEAKKRKKEQEAKLASKKKKEEDARRASALRQRAAADKKRQADAANRRALQKNQESKRIAEERQRLNEERAALAAEKAQIEREKKAVEQARQQAGADSNKKSSFKSDPCKGKSARFLSTCR